MIQLDSISTTPFDAGATLALHRHANAYAALVLEGHYEEASLDGRYACGPGDLILHPTYHAHSDCFGDESGTVLNIPLPPLGADRQGLAVYRGADRDHYLALARNKPDELAHAVLEEVRVAEPLSPPAWLSVFVAGLLAGGSVAICARRAGVSAEHASRICRSWFGMSPVQLRREDRIMLALEALREGATIAETAVLAGFSDQPHLTRVLRDAIGMTPRQVQTSEDQIRSRQALQTGL